MSDELVRHVLLLVVVEPAICAETIPPYTVWGSMSDELVRHVLLLVVVEPAMCRDYPPYTVWGSMSDELGAVACCGRASYMCRDYPPPPYTVGGSTRARQD